MQNYNIQSIIALNEHLISLEKLDDVFEYISEYLKNNFFVQRYSIQIKEKTIYKNFEENEFPFFENFEVSLNANDKLLIKIYYTKEQKNNIFSSLDFINSIFKLISQTIYCKFLQFKMLEVDIKDPLTGVYNRYFLDEYLKNIIPLSSRENKKIAFLKIGIDHFKAVIDEFNYEIGDKVLVELAKSLESSVRQSDIVARFDSDEFLVVLNNVYSEDNAIMIAYKLINNFKERSVIINKERNLTLKKTICTGVSIYPDDVDKPDEILRSSDIALYEARNLGRGQVFKFKKDDSNIELF